MPNPVIPLEEYVRQRGDQRPPGLPDKLCERCCAVELSPKLDVSERLCWARQVATLEVGR